MTHFPLQPSMQIDPQFAAQYYAERARHKKIEERVASGWPVEWAADIPLPVKEEEAAKKPAKPVKKEKPRLAAPAAAKPTTKKKPSTGKPEKAKPTKKPSARVKPRKKPSLVKPAKAKPMKKPSSCVKARKPVTTQAYHQWVVKQALRQALAMK